VLHSSCGLVAVVGHLGQELHHDALQGLGHRGDELGGRDGPVLALRSTRGSVAMVSLPVAVCDAHRGECRVVDALSAAGLQVVEGVLRDLCLEISDIDWDHSTVRYVSITDS
jgi:hypothetical protein